MENQSTLPRKARESWIDALKGWGMVLIVVGHVWSLSDVSLAYVWIFSFHVPLFFFAAGLTLKPEPENVVAFIRQRAVSLLLPYLVYALLGYLFYVAGYAAAAMAGKTVAQFAYGLWWPLLGVFYGTVGDGLLVNSPLWFLPALFLATLIVLIIHRLLRQRLSRYAALLVLFGIAWWIQESVKLPMSLTSALAAALFIQFGLDFRRTSATGRLPAWQASLLALLLLGITTLSPFNGAVGLAGPTINNPFLFLVFALAGTGLSVLLVQRLPAIEPLLAFLGRHSMGILVIHMLAIKGVKVLLSLGTGTSMDTMEHSLAWGLLVLVAASCIMWPTIWVIERWLPWTLGNRGRR